MQYVLKEKWVINRLNLSSALSSIPTLGGEWKLFRVTYNSQFVGLWKLRYKKVNLERLVKNLAKPIKHSNEARHVLLIVKSLALLKAFFKNSYFSEQCQMAAGTDKTYSSKLLDTMG